MNEQISWDQSLVKKYSSSNHFKLLNQLRNEVKKYPLNQKKNLSINKINDNIKNIDEKQISVNDKEDSYSKNLLNNKELNSNKSTVSFNNSKNFSIYNTNSSKVKSNEITTNTTDSKIKLPDDSSPSSFKVRLDQIDMK